MAGLFLLVWPTKWPQYLLTITAPLCLSSAEGLRAAVWEPLRRQVRHGKIREMISSLRHGGEIFNRYSTRELRKAWLWLLPGVITLSLIAFFPLIYQGAMAVTDFNAMSIIDGIRGGVWREFWMGITGQIEAVEVDLGGSTDVHYIGGKLLGPLFIGGIPDLLVFNILWTVLSVLLQAALGIAVALMLSRDGLRLRNFWRTLFILPWAIPEFVGALIWLRLLDPERGWLSVIENFPFQSLLAGLWNDPDKTLILLLLAATWYGFPFIMLAATAGLKLVPQEVYEMAAMDGANRWELFRDVTWPLLLPLVMPAILIRSIFAFNQFYLFYTMDIGFPTITFATLSYDVFSPTSGQFTGGQGGLFALSAAINIFTMMVLILLILWFNRISRASEGVTYA
jgi:arabinogalactan oligomer/maltooligosaccharide transport system permease protein